jgi:DNA-binding XRE family transcriptional regulator
MRPTLLDMTNTLSKGQILATENFGSWLDFRQAMIGKRISLGITQIEMANRLGVTQSAVSQFERIGSNPRLVTTLTYAQALGIKVKFSVESD